MQVDLVRDRMYYSVLYVEHETGVVVDEIGRPAMQLADGDAPRRLLGLPVAGAAIGVLCSQRGKSH